MAQKITTNQLKRLINEVLSEGGFYNPNHPIDDETQSKFLSACKHIIYPPGSNEPPLDEDEFMDIITKLGKWCYDDITAEYWHDQYYDNKDLYENKRKNR